MALSPIKMFQSDQSSLAQILAGGNQTISGIMDRAIQIGRDMSNKQLAQERDLLAQRQQETALFQRRAENLQQNNEDAINFARRAFESDRRYGMEQQQEQRMVDRDLFSRGIEEDRLGLAERGMAVSEGGLRLREQDAQAEQDRIQAEKDRVASMLTRPASSSEVVGPPAPVTKQSSDDAYAAEFEQRKAQSKLGVSPEIPFGAPAPAGPAKMDEKTATLRAAELGELLKSPAATAEQRAQARSELFDIQKMFPEGGSTEETAAGRRSARSLELREQALKDKNAEDEVKLLVGDTKAFMPQVPQTMRKEGGYTDADIGEAKAYDADRVASEINSAQNYSEEEYVNFKGMTLTPAQKEKRRKLWQYANRKSGTSSTTSAVDLIPGI